MNSTLRTIDARFLLEKPVYLSPRNFAAAFVGVGFLLIFAEALFFEYFSSFANSGFTTRRIIGFHLFPSEIWFIFVGNFLLFLILGTRNFLFPKRLLSNTGPIFLILAVYSTWFVYGSLAGNPWALQEFREVVFNAFSLPPILYFSSYLNFKQPADRFLVPGIITLLIVSIYGTHNAALIIGTFFASYWVLKLLFKTPFAVVGLAFTALPFLLKFSKPTVVMFAFCVMTSFLLAGYLNPQSVNWVFSRFKLRIVFIGLLLLLAILAAIALLNLWLGGAIEDIVRWYFLKERLTTSGETTYADISGGRFAIWEAAMQSWTNRPLFGFGLGSEVEAYSKGWVSKVQFHSYVVQALHNTGLIGTMLIAASWFVWLRRALRRVYRVANIDEKILLGSMLAFVLGILFFGLYGHSLSYPPSAQFFWLCIGFLCVVGRSSNRRVRL